MSVIPGKRDTRRRFAVEELEDRRVPATVFAVTDQAAPALLRFDSASPGTVTAVGTITGLTGTLRGIDFRPENGLLYGVATDAGNVRLYTINTTTAAATLVGGFAQTMTGTDFGVDFNPQVDRLRVVTDANESLRINPNDGSLVLNDTPLAYAPTDPASGNNPDVVAAAYANNFDSGPVGGSSPTTPGTSPTTLYGIDNAVDRVVLQGGPDGNPNPNGGQLFTRGGLGVATDARIGFDISSTGQAFAMLTAGATSTLHTVNLDLGIATAVGAVGGGQAVRDIAVAPVGRFQFASSSVNVAEGGNVTMTVQRVGGSDGPASVIWVVAGGSATPGADYTTPFAGTLTFAAGQTTATFTIRTLGDAFIEGTQTINLALVSSTNGTRLGARRTTTVNIVDNAAAPPISEVSPPLVVVSGTTRAPLALVLRGRIRRTFRIRNLGTSTVIGGRLILVFGGLRGRLFALPGQVVGRTPRGSRFVVVSVPNIPPGGAVSINVDFGLFSTRRGVTRIFAGFGTLPAGV